MKKPIMLTAIAAMAIGLTAASIQALAQGRLGSKVSGNQPKTAAHFSASPLAETYQELGISGKQLQAMNNLDKRIKDKFLTTFDYGVHMTNRQLQMQDAINEEYKAGLKQILSKSQYSGFFQRMMDPIPYTKSVDESWPGQNASVLPYCGITAEQFQQLTEAANSRAGDEEKLMELHRSGDTKAAFKFAYDMNRHARLDVAQVMTHAQHMFYCWKWYRIMEPAMAEKGEGQILSTTGGGTLKALEKHPPILP